MWCVLGGLVLVGPVPVVVGQFMHLGSQRCLNCMVLVYIMHFGGWGRLDQRGPHFIFQFRVSSKPLPAFS